VIKERFSGFHGILKVAEVGQTIADEMIQRLERAVTRDGPAKGFEVTEMIGEARAHQREHIARDRIRLEARARRQCRALRQALAIVVIKIPLPADGLLALHQEPCFASHLAIEVLHPVLLAPRGPTGKLLA
jgi:hypothetical protein